MHVWEIDQPFSVQIGYGCEEAWKHGSTAKVAKHKFQAMFNK